MLTELDPAASTVAPTPFAGPDHPMRRVTRSVAFEGRWDAERRRKVGELFDGMADEWATRDSHERRGPVADVLERGDLPNTGVWLELGAGTGAATALLQERADTVVALDLAAGMLAHLRTGAPRVLADACQLPVADHAASVVVMVNMLLFPAEVDRVLSPGGVLVWINSNGDQTPIHLPPEDVLAAMPGPWRGTTARAGSGFWLAARRAHGGRRSADRLPEP